MKIQITIETQYDECSDPASIRRELNLIAHAVAMLAGRDENKPNKENTDV